MAREPASRPLEDLRVVVTREEDPDGPLSTALAARGATVLNWAAVRTAAAADDGPLRAELERLGTFDWVVFTSRRAVDAVAGMGLPGPAGPRVAVVGPATADAVVGNGWRVDLVPDRATGAELANALARAGVGTGTRLLFPASEIAADTVPQRLRELGAEVVRVTAYRTVPAELDTERCGDEIAAGVDVVTFTSPSAVTNLRGALGGALFESLLERATAATIGPTTSRAVLEAGAARVEEAEVSTFAGLVDRIVASRRGT